MMLYPEHNIFKLSDKDYLISYHFNEFIKNFDNKNTELLNILLKDNLKEIQVCVQILNIFIYLKNMIIQLIITIIQMMKIIIMMIFQLD